MQVFISPHSDDATLFGAYTILREKPLVVTVTHATMQGDNGNERIVEDYSAMRILGAPVAFLGIDEDELTEEALLEHLKVFPSDTFYYIPEYEDEGNPHHNLINQAVKGLTDNYAEYKTYSGLKDRTVGIKVIPTDEELELKRQAMQCYRTQIENPNTAHYFDVLEEYV
jgi:LmbE family N-acetylglucosaminyl deacetylase